MSVHLLAIRMGGGRTQLSFILPPCLLFSQLSVKECSGKGHPAMGGGGGGRVTRKALGLGVRSQGLTVNAWSRTAWITSRKRILEVSVWPW